MKSYKCIKTISETNGQMIYDIRSKHTLLISQNMDEYIIIRNDGGRFLMKSLTASGLEFYIHESDFKEYFK